jgi:hypothetical protein
MVRMVVLELIIRPGSVCVNVNRVLRSCVWRSDRIPGINGRNICSRGSRWLVFAVGYAMLDHIIKRIVGIVDNVGMGIIEIVHNGSVDNLGSIPVAAMFLR